MVVIFIVAQPIQNCAINELDSKLCKIFKGKQVIRLIIFIESKQSK